MEFDYLHLYVPNYSEADYLYQQQWGFTRLQMITTPKKTTGIYQQSQILLFISAPHDNSSIIKDYLTKHPPGIGEVAFQVNNFRDFRAKLEQLKIASNKIIHPLTHEEGLTFTAWGDLRHSVYPYPCREALVDQPVRAKNVGLKTIDHVVLNITIEEFSEASQWYQQLFGWSVQQAFTINTPNSGLYSEALINSNGKVQFNLNCPKSATSQIQTFLNRNQGPGIQHVALACTSIVQTVTGLKQKGIKFLDVPTSYYQQQRSKNIVNLAKYSGYFDWSNLESLDILLDANGANSHELLLQIFSRPCYGNGTLFWEIIERQQRAKGFGEGNFQALYEAVEALEKSLEPQI